MTAKAFVFGYSLMIWLAPTPYFVETDYEHVFVFLNIPSCNAHKKNRKANEE